MPVALLSKSRFISGLQCPLRLWYQCYEQKLAAKISQGQQAIFDMGHKVGRLATKLFPKGILIEEDHKHHREAEITTAALLKNKRVPAIFEGAFLFDGIRIRVDVLERVGGREMESDRGEIIDVGKGGLQTRSGDPISRIKRSRD